ncbi:uracil-DNA glycosylase [Paenibacillus tengchongensis]|uniref:uracil-DNA glycosylase n=1 Tax=Paenibacillus tengchongensis TaxID=2608684 RepID=UPI00124EB1B3|nr:uracil-DNA glycosylase [Paenibacillus tengchongensis]
MSKGRRGSCEGYSQKGDAWLHPVVEEESIFTSKAQKILDLIVSQQVCPNLGNFYAESNVKRLNLMHYFNLLFWNKPEVLLIGEAPGKDGCAITGIPFTSERVIRQGGLKKHFPTAQFILDGNQWERSAHFFWECVAGLHRPVVAWNVVPLHPLNDNGDNRTPEQDEIEWGMTLLPLVIDLFPGIKVVSVGKNAKSACRKLKINTIGHLNHPRRADLFQKQFGDLFPIE